MCATVKHQIIHRKTVTEILIYLLSTSVSVIKQWMTTETDERMSQAVFSHGRVNHTQKHHSTPQILLIHNTGLPLGGGSNTPSRLDIIYFTNHGLTFFLSCVNNKLLLYSHFFPAKILRTSQRTPQHVSILQCDVVSVMLYRHLGRWAVWHYCPYLPFFLFLQLDDWPLNFIHWPCHDKHTLTTMILWCTKLIK